MVYHFKRKRCDIIISSLDNNADLFTTFFNSLKFPGHLCLKFGSLGAKTFHIPSSSALLLFKKKCAKVMMSFLRSLSGGTVI